MTSATGGRIVPGTSSWSETSWKGAFYPPGTKPAEQLAFYATQFPTVEADNRVVLDRDDRLKRWAKLLRRVLPRSREIFAYANNHFAGFAPATIRALMREIEALHEP